MTHRTRLLALLRHTGAALALLISFPALARATAGSVPLTPELRAEIDAYVRQALPRFEQPAAALAIVQDGAITYTQGWGARGDGETCRVDGDTRFMIGSATKPMTALMTATLVDDGLLAWDTPVTELLPTFSLSDAAFTSDVRLRELLSHTSGVRDNSVVLFVDHPSPLALIDAVSRFPLAAPPRQQWVYSNYAFSVAGLAAARAAGARLTDRALERGYERLMGERVFERIGMPHTTLDFDRALRDRNHARPYSYSPIDHRQISPLRFERFTTPIAPAGAVWSSASDLARFVIVQLNDGLNPEGFRVVSPERLLETQSVQIAVSAVQSAGYGLGWGVLGSGEDKQLLHDGYTLGFTARLLAVPARGWGLVVLANRGDATAFLDAVTRYVAAVLFARERPDDDDLVAADQQHRAALDRAFAATSPVSSRALAPFMGDYERGIRVSWRAQTMILRTVYGERPFRAAPGKSDTFIGVGAVQPQLVAQFHRAPTGAILLRLGYPDPDGELRTVVEAERHEHRPPKSFADRSSVAR